MKKILHLLSSKVFSGAENVACQIISMFKDDSAFEMVYCSPDGLISSSLKERGVKFLVLEKFEYLNIRKIISEYKPDIIHAHDVTASIYAAMLPPKYKVISHMHVNNANMSKFCLKSVLYRFSACRYNNIFWVSNTAFSSYIYREQLKMKSSILYNIIDKEALLARINKDTNDYSYDIAYVGRITYQKHPEKLINIIKKVHDSYPNLRVAIVGRGDLLNSTKEYTVSNGLSETVDFLGFMENPTKILQMSKLMIMTSRFEGTPMTALEAMCLGTPIVSTPTDGMVDLIKNGENGFLSDNDDILVKSCLAIIKDSSLRNKLSVETQKMYSKYCDAEAYKKAIYNAYMEQL